MSQELSYIINLCPKSLLNYQIVETYTIMLNIFMLPRGSRKVSLLINVQLIEVNENILDCFAHNVYIFSC